MEVHEVLTKLETFQRKRRAKKLEDQLGVLAGGNAGIYVAGERPAGSCPRKAVMRSWFALEPMTDMAKQFIFDAGLNSEIHTVAELEEMFAAEASGLRVLTQQQCGVHWKTSLGVPVRGSPDFILAEQDGTPVLGLELKNMNSVYKALGVLSETPACDAAVQAGMYSWAHNYCPWAIIYTSRTQHHNLASCFGEAAGAVRTQDRYRHLIDWGEKTVPRKEGRGKNVTTVEEKVATPKSLLGFRVEWQLVWDRGVENGVLGLRWGGVTPSGGHPDNQPRVREDQTLWTVITVDRIKAFYDLISNPKGLLPDRPENIDPVTGKAKGWRPCQKEYCEWHDICNLVDKFKGATFEDMADLINNKRREGEDV